MNNTIFELKSNYEFLQDQMESDPENENFEMLKDTLDSITDEFEIKAENTGYVIKNIMAKAKAKREVAKQLQAEAQLLEKRAYLLLDHIGEAMESMSISKISGVVNTFKVNKSQRVVVDNIEEVPEELCSIVVKPNLTKIKNLMKIEGTDEFDYAHIEKMKSIGLQGVTFSETAKKAVDK
ncbi:siphovirus Gp157 family protein [Lactococcus nasutitermitis]|uniref:Siphovirus Gp157 family protein n=1 Tax=Lactococcus nasutitermitis TaxID=1652957 RepID=A0ABV9JD14_9LACT|nr:siphovirus Gp157 family protein [Lactococcus nasutitermitis]